MERPPRPETQVEACPRRPVRSFPRGFIPQAFIESLERNQKIATCCRHPENHDIEARKSHPDEKDPDIYNFHCTCGREHTTFCVGMKTAKIAIANVLRTRKAGPERDSIIEQILAEQAQKDRRPAWEGA